MRAAGVAAAAVGVRPLPDAAVTTARRRCPAAGMLHGCSCVVCLHSAWSRVLFCLYAATHGPLCGSGVQHNCCIFQGAAAALLLLPRAQGDTLLLRYVAGGLTGCSNKTVWTTQLMTDQTLWMS